MKITLHFHDDSREQASKTFRTPAEAAGFVRRLVKLRYLATGWEDEEKRQEGWLMTGLFWRMPTDSLDFFSFGIATPGAFGLTIFKHSWWEIDGEEWDKARMQTLFEAAGELVIYPRFGGSDSDDFLYA